MKLLPIYENIYALARPYLNTRKNDIHIEISHRFAWKLLETEPGDPEVVIPAILCHDLGWIRVPEALQLKAFGPGFDPDLRRVHEREGVKLARGILTQLNYDRAKIEEILEIIAGHDSREQALSESDRIVKDADKLFRYTPVGREIDRQRFRKERQAYTRWLADQIEGWFFTATAVDLARQELHRPWEAPDGD